MRWIIDMCDPLIHMDYMHNRKISVLYKISPHNAKMKPASLFLKFRGLRV